MGVNSRDIPFRPAATWGPDAAEIRKWQAYSAWTSMIRLPAPDGLPFQIPGDEWLAATIVCGIASLDLLNALEPGDEWPNPEQCATCGHAWCEGFTSLALTSVELADRLAAPERNADWGARVGSLAVARGEAIAKMKVIPPYLLKWVQTWNDEMRDAIRSLAEIVEPRAGRPSKAATV